MSQRTPAVYGGEYVRKVPRISLEDYLKKGKIHLVEKFLKDKAKELYKLEEKDKQKERDLERVKRVLNKKEQEILSDKKNILSDKEDINVKEKYIVSKEEELLHKEKELKKIMLVSDARKELFSDLEDREIALRKKEEELRYESAKMKREIERLKEEKRMEKEASTRREKERPEIEKNLLEKEKELKRRESYLLDKESEIDSLKADLEFREADMEKKIGPIKYKEEELSKREEDLRFREEKLERKMTLLKEKELKKITIPAEDEEKIKIKETLEKLEKEIKIKEEELKKREEYLKSKEEGLAQKSKEIVSKQLAKKEEEKEEEKKTKKVKTGIARLDDLLLGGVPFGSNIMVYAPPFTGMNILLNAFIVKGLSNGVACIIVTVDKPVTDVKKQLKQYFPLLDSYEKNNNIGYIDIYSRRMGIPCDQPNTEYVDNIRDLDVIRLTMNTVLNKLEKKVEYYRIVFPMSTLTANIGAQSMFNFLEDLTGMCKRDKSVALYSLTKGMHSETDVQILRHLMDGIIEFKEENLRTFFCVQGICDVQTRSWIQYKFIEKELIIGSFSLDYIR